jgi:hypothetical protein
MGEAYLTWLIDRAGNLKLRGFTQTIDRFDENQGLQETGIGIYFKEDFDNAKDLSRRVRSRFTRKRRSDDKRRAVTDDKTTTEQSTTDAEREKQGKKKNLNKRKKQ